MADLYRISSEREPGNEPFIVDSIGEDSQDAGQDESIQQLRSLLIGSSLACQHSTSSVDECCESCSPITSSCSTPSNVEDSALSISLSSEDSVGSSIPDELNQSSPRCGDDRTGAVTKKNYDFFLLRITYLLVTLVIMLADGLQGKIFVCSSRKKSEHVHLIEPLFSDRNAPVRIV